MDDVPSSESFSRSDRSMAERTRPLQLALGLLVGFALIWMSVIAMSLPDRSGTRLDLSGDDTFELGGLMPGDRIVPHALVLNATGELDYRMHVEWTGSQALADQVQVTVTLQETGRTLYQGPIGALSIGGSSSGSPLDEPLRDGQAERVSITGGLPLSAGNDVQGATLSVHVIVDSVQSAA
jgi:hypothetical protein